MKDKFIIAPATIAAELSEAERHTVAASILLDDIVDPIFQCFTLEGAISEYSKQTGGDKDAAARLWMEENYGTLYAAFYAANVLIGEAADTLQLLPIRTEKEAQV